MLSSRENMCNRRLAKQTQYKELTVFYRVYNTQGYGFLENVYENAMMIELIFCTSEWYLGMDQRVIQLGYTTTHRMVIKILTA